MLLFVFEEGLSHVGPKYLKAAGDRDSVAMEHLQEMVYGIGVGAGGRGHLPNFRTNFSGN